MCFHNLIQLHFTASVYLSQQLKFGPCTVLGSDNQKVNFDNDNPITPIFKSDNDKSGNYNTKLSEVNDNPITITTF